VCVCVVFYTYVAVPGFRTQDCGVLGCSCRREPERRPEGAPRHPRQRRTQTGSLLHWHANHLARITILSPQLLTLSTFFRFCTADFQDYLGVW
jgi:hypothetical protein